MGSRFEIKITSEGLPRITRSEIRKMKANGLGHAGEAWHTRIAQRKFTPAAAAKYHYTRRKTKNILKGTIRETKSGRKLAPSGLPLVWSGRSQLLGKLRTIKASSTRAVVRVPIRQFNIRRPKNADPKMDMLREYKSTTPSDDRILAKVARDQIRNLLSRNKKRVQIIV